MAEILETCLARLASGASIDDCLAAYPAQRAALEPPLRAASGLMRLPHPAMPSSTRAALEARMLARAAARRAAPPPAPWWRLAPTAILAGFLRALGYGGPLSTPWLRMAATAVALVLALVLSVGAYAAARAIVSVFIAPPTPTPTLIPTIAPSSTATPATKTFMIEGVVEQIDQEAWVVDGTTIAIDDQTTISGTPSVGAIARVSGIVRSDGAWVARAVTAGTPPTATFPPVLSPTPTPFVFPTVTPLAVPTSPPAPVVAPGGSDPSKGDGGNDPSKQCQGQQIGRDEKKCDPKPKPNPNPPPKPKDDGKKDDGKKDSGKKDSGKKGK